jgi:AcrR family transcriptional regulator
MMQRADSRLRNAPVGRKGKGTVDRIIDAAADLLESRGYEALTTNHIAEAAGVNIATLYKYFANKEAILTALHLRLSQRWKEALTHRLDQIRDGAHWREIVCQIIDVAAERRQQQASKLPRRSSSLFLSFSLSLSLSNTHTHTRSFEDACGRQHTRALARI